MTKIWKILPGAREDFFKKFPEHDRILLQLLYNRGFKEKEEIEYFLRGDFSDCHDPFIFRQMSEAVDLVIKNIKEGNKICVYGDYDADGATASALLYDIFSTFKADCFVYIPERVGEGYGVNEKALDKIASKGVKLLITVDCGIRNKEEIASAKKKGMDVIITDHHQAPDEESELPDCLIVNPQLKTEKYPFRRLAGVGVAFKFCQALISKAKLTAEQKERLAERSLDLVAIGTVADCMPIIDENRLLLKKGLEVLNNTRRPGLRELIKVSKIEGRKLDAWNIGFQLGPRLNASSRMGSVSSAYNLLITKDQEEAEKEAVQLDERNGRRQKETEEVMREVEEQLKKQLEEKIIIGVWPGEGKPWNEGIVGLVAGKITEKYYKPALVITKDKEGWRGSGRSIDEFDLFSALEKCGDVLEKFGGHTKACGFNTSSSNLPLFIKKIRKIAGQELKDAALEPKIIIDCELPVEKISKTLFREIKKLEPFGQENFQPKFLTKRLRILDMMTMGKESQHIKFRFNSFGGSAGGFWAIGFNRAEAWSEFKIGDFVDAVYYLEENDFNGSINLQLKLIDLKISDGT